MHPAQAIQVPSDDRPSGVQLRLVEDEAEPVEVAPPEMRALAAELARRNAAPPQAPLALSLAGHFPALAFSAPPPKRNVVPQKIDCRPGSLVGKTVRGLRVLKYVGRSRRGRWMYQVQCVYCRRLMEREGRSVACMRPDGCGCKPRELG